MPTPDIYRCVACGGTFDFEWTDAEAREEFDLLFPDENPNDVDVICHDCWLKLPIAQQAKESSEGEA